MNLDFLSHLYAVKGPYATVYLETSGAAEDAARRLDLQWRALRDELGQAGADDATVEAIAGAIRLGEGTGDGQVLVAAGGALLLDRHLPRAPRRELAHWGVAPHVMPLVAALADVVPHIVVVADRTGANITAYGEHGDEATTREVVGDDDVIRKVNPGGWSQRRFQQRAEDSWESNAKQIADQVAWLADLIRPRIIVLAGDVRARTLLHDAMPKNLQDVVVEVDEGGRAAGASEEALQQRVAQLTAEFAARDALARVEKFVEERGQHDRAVESLAATVEAVRRAQVETLVLDDDPTSTLTLWVGPDPTMIAVRGEELVDLGVEEPQEVRADAALLRAIVATGADIVVVPGGTSVADGVGAVLRYADASTPA